MIYVANSYIQFDVFFTTLLASLVIDEYYIDLGRQRDTEILQLRLDELCFLNDCSLCQIYSWDDFDGGSFVISKFYPFLKFVSTGDGFSRSNFCVLYKFLNCDQEYVILDFLSLLDGKEIKNWYIIRHSTDNLFSKTMIKLLPSQN